MNPARQPAVVTIDRLRALRHGLAALRDARATLGKAANVAVPRELGAFESLLAGTAVAVEVPCTTCRQPYRVVVRVGDRPPTEPHAVLCEQCNSRVEAEVLRAGGGGE